MLRISSQVEHRPGYHVVTCTTNDNDHAINIPPKSEGSGSSVNGGELLFLALATCYCNDLYREAAKRNIVVKRVEVEVRGEFDEAPGSPAENITYHALIEAEASEADILELAKHTDTVAEIQNTLRKGMDVMLATVKAMPV
jgi:uncharacterized OsmC-like protein